MSDSSLEALKDRRNKALDSAQQALDAKDCDLAKSAVQLVDALSRSIGGDASAAAITR